MKKRLSLFLIVITMIGLVGCGDSTKDKALEHGKLALANKEYDKAISSFELALNEDNTDTEVIELYEIVKKYKEAKDFFEKNDIENAEKSLGEINSKYTEYSIKGDIDELRTEVNSKKESLLEEKAIEENMAKEIEAKEKSVTKDVPAQEPAKPSKKNEYLQKYSSTEFFESEIYKNSNYEVERVTQSYELWDDFLNEIWAVLKKDLSKNEMDNLTKIQRQWIKNKEAKEKSIYDDGGNTQAAVSWSLESTKIRCRELIEGYMN